MIFIRFLASSVAERGRRHNRGAQGRDAHSRRAAVGASEQDAGGRVSFHNERYATIVLTWPRIPGLLDPMPLSVAFAVL
ncbi:MAG: hypothetical protein ACOCW3_06515, partial [Spirochaetota bacterium]